MRAPHHAQRKTRLGIATDEPVTCAGLQPIFRDAEHIRLLWLPPCPKELIRALDVFHVDAVLLDTACGFPSDIPATLVAAGIKAQIILWKRVDPEDLKSPFPPPPVAAILDKRSAPLMVLTCVESVLAGKPWETRQANPAAPVSEQPSAPVHISPREADLINLIAEGLSNREIADRLNLSEGSVRVYFSRLFSKLGVSDRLGLVLYAMPSANQHNLTRGPGLRRAPK